MTRARLPVDDRRSAERTGNEPDARLRIVTGHVNRKAHAESRATGRRFLPVKRLNRRNEPVLPSEGKDTRIAETALLCQETASGHVRLPDEQIEVIRPLGTKPKPHT